MQLLPFFFLETYRAPLYLSRLVWTESFAVPLPSVVVGAHLCRTLPSMPKHGKSLDHATGS